MGQLVVSLRPLCLMPNSAGFAAAGTSFDRDGHEADICLVPQIFNAQRFGANLDHLPTVMRSHEHCLGLPAFAQSAPAMQPDAD